MRLTSTPVARTVQTSAVYPNIFLNKKSVIPLPSFIRSDPLQHREGKCAAERIGSSWYVEQIVNRVVVKCLGGLYELLKVM